MQLEALRQVVHEWALVVGVGVDVPIVSHEFLVH